MANTIVRQWTLGSRVLAVLRYDTGRGAETALGLFVQLTDRLGSTYWSEQPEDKTARPVKVAEMTHQEWLESVNELTP